MNEWEQYNNWLHCLGEFVAKALTWVFKATVNSQDCVPNVLVNNIIDINSLVYGV
jgi:hypothetical protein